MSPDPTHPMPAGASDPFDVPESRAAPAPAPAARLPPRQPFDTAEPRRRIPLVPILQGMGVTLQHFFKKPVTVEYPEQKKPVADRFRGRIYLKLETCIGCTLCAQACPNGSCYMVDYDPGFDTPQNKRKKFPAVEISKCMYCSLCEEVCPTDSIRMGKEYETGGYVRDFDYKPDRLSQNEASLGRGPYK